MGVVARYWKISVQAHSVIYGVQSDTEALQPEKPALSGTGQGSAVPDAGSFTLHDDHQRAVDVDNVAEECVPEAYTFTCPPEGSPMPCITAVNLCSGRLERDRTGDGT